MVCINNPNTTNHSMKLAGSWGSLDISLFVYERPCLCVYDSVGHEDTQPIVACRSSSHLGLVPSLFMDYFYDQIVQLLAQYNGTFYLNLTEALYEFSHVD